MGNFKLIQRGEGRIGRFFWLVCLMGVLGSVLSVGADDFSGDQAEFESFKKDNADFESYKDAVNRDFKAYKTIIDEEFKAYRNQILKVWQVPEVTSKKRYVAYSPDYRVRKVVDYGAGTVTISAVVPDEDPGAEGRLAGHLKILIEQDTLGAYREDVFTQGVEKKLKKAVNSTLLKTGQVAKAPLVADMATGKSSPTAKELNAAVAELVKKASIETSKSTKIPASRVVTLKVKLPQGSMAVKARGFLAAVQAESGKRGVNPALVLAVMETESAFNPMARSYVPAYGLMQIVPRSAGRDASKIVLGKDLILSPSYLYNSGNNIAMGVAYLSLLDGRYLAAIKNPESRMYCVIAAYNTGAGNVARAFVGTTNINKAAKRINAKSPQDVYRTLRSNLPYKETREYLHKVSARIETYQAT